LEESSHGFIVVIARQLVGGTRKPMKHQYHDQVSQMKFEQGTPENESEFLLL
jgi:hypothetical protein